jgi:hypothetical protein
VRRRLLDRPEVRNALGLHSVTRCLAGSGLAELFLAQLAGDPNPQLPPCRCTCRRCRRHHRGGPHIP